MNKVFISTGALLGMPNGRNYRLLEDVEKRLDCDGFEFMVYGSWYPKIDELIRTVKGYKLNIPVIHCKKSLSELIAGGKVWFEDGQYKRYTFTPDEDEENYKNAIEDFKINLRVAKEFGADKMVFHLWNGLISDKNIELNIKRFGVFKEMAEKAGISLMVENVICNKNTPLYDLNEVYKSYPDVKFVYDTKMAEFHGETLDLFKPEWDWMLKDGHIGHLHINDYGGGLRDFNNLKVLPIGKGHVDFDAFFEKLSGYGYTGDYTIESTAFSKEREGIDFDMLNECIDNLRKLTEKYQKEILA